MRRAIGALVVAVVGVLSAGAGAPPGGNVVASDAGGGLWFVDARTGKATAIGRIEVGATDPGPRGPVLTDVAFDAASGAVYGISFDYFYALNLADPQKSRCVGALGASSMNALVVAPDGLVFGATIGGDVYQIDPRTAKTRRVGNLGGGLGSSGDLAFHGGVLYATVTGAGGGGDTLVFVDPKTGKATRVGPLTAKAGAVWNVYGLVSVGGELVALTAAGETYRVDPKTAGLALIGKADVTYWGAAEFELVF